MPKNCWAHSSQASQYLGVPEKTLNAWIEIGYLKYGTHWRKKKSIKTIFKRDEILFHLDWCKEEMEYWKSHNAIIQGLAA